MRLAWLSEEELGLEVGRSREEERRGVEVAEVPSWVLVSLFSSNDSQVELIVFIFFSSLASIMLRL